MIPKYNEMYNEVLEVLNDKGTIDFKTLVNEVSDKFKLNDEERNMLTVHGTKTVISDRIGWTKTYLKKANLLINEKKGVYEISKEGKVALDKNVRINNDFLMQYKSFEEFLHPTKSDNNITDLNDTSTPDEKIEQAISMKEYELQDDLLDVISNNSPEFFERLVLDLLDKMGYAFDVESIKMTTYSGDEGIDGIIEEDSFGFNSIYVQAKRWKGSVGRPEIQKFLGAVAGQGGTKGLFITTSSFTQEAIKYAKKQLNVRLVLVDGAKLTKLMIKYNLGVSTVKSYQIKQIDSDYFEE